MVESPTPPPLEESWRRFEKKLKDQQSLSNKPCATQRKNLLSLRLATVAGIIILLAGTLSLSFPVKAKALGEKIVSTVANLLSGTQMNIKTEYKNIEPDQVPPPPKDFREVNIEQERTVSLEEAKSASPFSIATPQYIPANYKLEQVKFQETGKATAVVTLKYNSSNTNYLLISEMNASDGYVQGYGYDIEDAIVQNIKIGDNNGRIIIFKNENISITWIKQGIVYELEGKIEKEEALKIVKSMH